MAYVDVFALMTLVLLFFLPLIPLLRSSGARALPPSAE
jgi:hypothetical protein